jgi:hypothetical protein
MASSPLALKISAFNPYSLLHIPLYGVLTFLLYFSFSPVKFRYRFSRKKNNPLVQPHGTWQNTEVDTKTQRLKDRMAFVVPGIIGLVVAVADEWHQSFVPSRDASLSDVFLDIAGIVLVLFLMRIGMSRSGLTERPKDTKTL